MADRGIFPADLAERCKARAGEAYRPSNGTEGDIFEAAWCCGCRHQHDADGNGCLIALRAWAYDLGDEGYPAEFVYGADGQPTCTAFCGLGETPRCDATADLFGARAHG